MREREQVTYDDGGDDTTYLGNDDIRREEYRDHAPDDIGRVAYGNMNEFYANIEHGVNVYEKENKNV